MIFTLLACFQDVQDGDVLVCFDDDRPGQDTEVGFEGDVTAIGSGDCGTELTIDDGEGTVHTLGLLVTDEAGNDITPELDVQTGDQVVGTWVYKFVWGDVAGFSIYSDERLLAAADEGRQGGAFKRDEESLTGFTVEYGDKIGTEATDCMPMDGYNAAFNAESEITQVTPIDSAPITLQGTTYDAMAVAAWKWGEPTGCEMSDATDHLAWVVTR